MGDAHAMSPRRPGHHWDDRYNLHPNDYDHSYPPRPGPTGQYPAPDLTDEAQFLGLDPRDGDPRPTVRDFNHPWGKVVHFANDARSFTLVQTDAFPRPFPWAVSARFSVDGVNFFPAIPGTYPNQIHFDFIKSYDVKTGPVKEGFDLGAGDTMPFCALIARSLTVSANISGETFADLWVQFVVCPTTQIDCAELVGPSGGTPIITPGFATANQTRYPQASPIIAPNFLQVLAANPNRQRLFVQNNAAADLMVSLAAGANFTPGSEFGVMVLPGGISAVYESDAAQRYTGPVSISWAGASSPAGYALVTEIVP